MAKPTLSICIPSYNRPQKALNCLRVISPQIHDLPVKIVVLDNCSDQDYLTLFKNAPDLNSLIESGVLKVHRNSTNIGMSANLMRSFEFADEEWMWMLSDDDEIYPGALATIFDAMNEYGEEFGFIKFSSPRSEPKGDTAELRSLEDFLDWNSASDAAFNGFLFISNGIYRVADFKPLLGIGYNYAYTYIPHFMMLTFYLESGHSLIISRERIVDYVPPEVGYSYGMVAGIGVGAPKHALLKLSPSNYRKFLSLFFPHNDFKVVIDLFFQCRRDASVYVCGIIAGQYVDYVSVARSLPRAMFLRFFARATRYPWLFIKLISLVEWSIPSARSHINEIKKRYPPRNNESPIVG